MNIKKITITFLAIFLLYLSTTLLAEVKILFLGDSITAGYGIEKELAFPALIEEILSKKGYQDLKIINGGISGSTTASALSRLKWYKRAKPDILFLALGANDGLRGLSTEKMKENLDLTINFAKKHKMKIIFAGMEIPPNYGEKYSSDFRTVFKDLAEKHKITFIPFLLKDVGGISTLNQPDGIHPNEKGHEVISKNVISYIMDKL